MRATGTHKPTGNRVTIIRINGHIATVGRGAKIWNTHIINIA